jgi:hypothetical protein
MGRIASFASLFQSCPKEDRIGTAIATARRLQLEWRSVIVVPFSLHRCGDLTESDPLIRHRGQHLLPLRTALIKAAQVTFRMTIEWLMNDVRPMIDEIAAAIARSPVSGAVRNYISANRPACKCLFFQPQPPTQEEEGEGNSYPGRLGILRQCVVDPIRSAVCSR